MFLPDFTRTTDRPALTALTAARPRARYTVGRDTRLIGLLSRLPLRTQDRLGSGVLGLYKVEKAGRSGK